MLEFMPWRPLAWRSLSVAILLFACPYIHAATAKSEPGHAALATAWLARHEFQIEIADDFASREYGLMNRTSMAANHGMLFVFDAPAMQTFWMKNTLIPLDMLFFDRDYKLVNVQQRVPPCRADPCPVYGSTGPAQYVLELNGGEAEKLGVKPGDKLTVHR
ncbi:MAG: DUF192 domain-containing protein [Rudaea sp.]